MTTSPLDLLRQQLLVVGLDGFLIPMADEFQSEYVPLCARRIQYISGFTGSAGFIIVLSKKAAFFTDGRYTLQAQQEVTDQHFELFDSSDRKPTEWLVANAKEGALIGFDPWLHTHGEISRFTKATELHAIRLRAVLSNPIDHIWSDRPQSPCAPVFIHPLAYAGRSREDKIKTLADQLKAERFQAAILSDPNSVAWLLNIRGGDVPNTPLPLSYALLYQDQRVEWFIDPQKLPKEQPLILGPQVTPQPIERFTEALTRIDPLLGKIRLNSEETPHAIVQQLEEMKVSIDFGVDPCVLPRACKNEIELNGARAAHLRDGVALVRFFAWLDVALAGGSVTEIDASNQLERFRSEGSLYCGPSFDTISGAGSHGAVVHYRATATTNRRLEWGQIYLLDSGGQYFDGTTDVTRTMALGTPEPIIQDRFTRVLKGHIALAQINFPEGTTGADLDVLARQYLWEVGLDYSHGTGHGVGSFLSVHEGPHGISKRNKIPLQKGMIVSNEPGYYESGQYGIRIENLVACIPRETKATEERKMLGFETLTLVPIDQSLLKHSLLTKSEIIWLNAYHRRIRDSLSHLLDQNAKEWLLKATKPVSENSI